MYCKEKPPLTYSVPCIHGLSPPRGGINSLKKIKIVYQSGKCPFYNSLRIINYLIPPLEGGRGEVLNINKLQNLRNLNKQIRKLENQLIDKKIFYIYN